MKEGFKDYKAKMKGFLQKFTQHVSFEILDRLGPVVRTVITVDVIIIIFLKTENSHFHHLQKPNKHQMQILV